MDAREGEPSVNIGVDDFTSFYFQGLPADELSSDSPQTHKAIASGHYDLARQRVRGEHKIRVFTADLINHGWDSHGRIVIEVVSDDRQFLINSITANLSDHGFSLARLLHPVLIVDRDEHGGIRQVDVHDPVSQNGGEHLRESWIHIELDDPFTEQIAEEITREIKEVLHDVVIVTDDWQAMVAQMQDILDGIPAIAASLDDVDVREATEFAQWLIGGHFTFLGYREYVIADENLTEVMRALPETGLGILREGRLISHTAQNEAAAEAARGGEHPLLLVTKADARSTVRRSVHLDRISYRTFDESGKVVGERRFLGLFDANAYAESIQRIPILDAKAEAVLRTLRYSPESYNGKAVLALLESFPRDELFSAEVADLARVTSELLHASDRRRLRSFVRRDQLGRFLSILIYMPPDRFTTKTHQRINDVLTTLAEGGVRLEHTVWLAESGLARLHIVVRPLQATTIDAVDERDLQKRLQAAVRTWDDQFAYEISQHEFDAPIREGLIDLANTVPDAYREDISASTGVDDMVTMQSLESDSIALAFRAVSDDAPMRFTVYRRGAPLSLATILPIFTSLGVAVIDERPYELDGKNAWIYDFGLDRELDDQEQENFKQAFTACWRGDIEVDGYNRLVVGANLPWRSVVILRAYAKYLRQAGNPFSDDFVQTALLSNSNVAALLIELFDVMFNPELELSMAQREERRDDVLERMAVAIEAVVSRDADGVLRSLLNLMSATIRTNFYQKDHRGEFKPAVSLKLEPKKIDNLPEPRPQFEIFCYSPRVEGVHLRFGLVARGGLRWSDRKEDFRTEVLGLVKAQMVKNSVIVPTGSKGGFFAKQLPDPSDREAWLAEGIEAYKIFISSLLDVTDNRTPVGIEPPRDVVRWDDDDSYLVVAADKGTAAFSDIANQVSADYGFWLGDAFASGGSVGYDHKAMGITARGAWESVKRHFRDRGIDCQSQDFTCVGVGDMSGDVFGNGMMLSQHTKLIAAFDHRHIFIDPNPDPAKSFDERVRLFNLPRSSWADYDSSLISEGGGVFERSMKRIPISEPMKKVLGIDADVLTPPQLISAVLCAPVDLLFNGGIGTYVKGSGETHNDVGDKANDSLRVNGKDLRCLIVGEGGNLGFTQLGRIEYALQGGRINTDFIDNSAGVDTSDHEVNIKILLDSVIRDSKLNVADRDELLASMTNEVAQLVLSHNISQNLAITTAVSRAKYNLLGHWDLMRDYERQGRLDRALEFLPDDEELTRRRSEDIGLTAPELSVLLAYTKIDIGDELKNMGAAKDPFFDNLLQEYFPHALRERFADVIEQHPLRDDIIVTRIVNDVVDAAGITYFRRLEAETGADISMLARAHVVATQLLDARSLLHRLDYDLVDLDADIRTRIRLKIRAHVEQGARWLVNNTQGMTAPEVVDQLAQPVQEMLRALPSALFGRVKTKYEQEVANDVAAGLPTDLAELAAMVRPAAAVLGLAQLAHRAGLPAVDVASMYFRIGERLGIDRLARQVDVLIDDGRWNGMARAALADDVRSTQVALTNNVIASTPPSASPADRVAEWVSQREGAIDGSLDILRHMWAEGELDLSRLMVSLQMAKRLLNG